MRLSTLICISAFVAVALSQPFHFVNQTYYPLSNNTNLYKYGEGYVFGQEYFDFTTGFVNRVAPNDLSCNFPGSVVAVTSNHQFYCFNKNGSQNSIIEVNPSNNNILNTYPYTGKNTEFMLSNGRNVILISGIARFDISADVFNTESGQYTCHVENIKIDHSEELTDLAVYGDNLIILTVDAQTLNNTKVYNIPCSSGQPIITQLDRARYEMNPFNGGSILLSESVYVYKELEYYMISPVVFDLLGVPRFGEDLSLVDVAIQVNDTNLLVLHQNEVGTLDFHFNIITNQLRFSLVNNISTALNVAPEYVVGLVGNSSQALFTDSSFFLFMFDYETQTIEEVWNTDYTYLLSNGSTIYLSWIGYFIKNPAGDIHWIKSAPYFEVVVSPNGDTVWALYNPNFIPVFGYANCSLIEIQLTTSTVKQYSLSECPCNTNGGGLITLDLHAVDVDASGNPHVLYSCNYYFLVVANQSAVVTTWTDKRLDFFNGPVYFNLSQMLISVINPFPYNISVFNVFLNNKTISNGVNFSDASIGYASPLNENYCILGWQESKQAVFATLEIPSLTVVNKFASNVSYDFNLKNQFMSFIVLGGDNTSSNFSYIAYETSETNLTFIQPDGSHVNYDFKNESEGTFSTAPNNFYYYAVVDGSLLAIQLYQLNN